MQISRISGYFGRAFGPLKTDATARLTVPAAVVLAASAVYRVILALTADRVSILTVLPGQGEMGSYNDMAANHYIDISTGPLYPLFLMFIRLISEGRGLRPVFAIQGCAIVLSAAAAGIIAARLSNRSAGLAALVLVSGYPAFIMYGLVTLPVVFCVTVVFLLMLVLTSDSRDGAWDVPGSVMSGILGAVALLLHPAMIYLLPGLFAAVRKRLLMASILILLVAPWGVRNCIIAGRPVPVYELRAYEITVKPALWLADGWKPVKHLYFNASFLMKKSLERAHMPVLFGNRAANNHVLQYSFVILALLGLAGVIRYSDRSHIRTMLPMISYAVLTILITHYSRRQRVILEPALLIYAAVLIGKSLRRRKVDGSRPESPDDKG